MAIIDLQNAATSQSDVPAAAEDALSQLDREQTRLVGGFFSGDRYHPELPGALRERLPNSVRQVTMSTVAGITHERDPSAGPTLGALGGDSEIGIGWGMLGDLAAGCCAYLTKPMERGAVVVAAPKQPSKPLDPQLGARA